MLITADGALMSESLFGLLVALSLLAAYRLLEAPAPGRAVALGALAGLAALTRGEALLLLLLLLAPVVRRPRGGRAVLIAICAALAVIAPWTARNWVTFHQPVLISTDLAAAIAGANCQTAYYSADKLGSWDVKCVKPYPGNEAASLDRPESDGVSYALHHLGRLPVVAFTRLARVWGLRRNALPGGTLPRDSGRSPAVLEVGFLVYSSSPWAYTDSCCCAGVRSPCGS